MKYNIRRNIHHIFIFQMVLFKNMFLYESFYTSLLYTTDENVIDLFV